MKIATKIFPAKPEVVKKFGILANVSITIDDVFTVCDIVIRKGKKAKDDNFVCFPSRAGKDEKYYGVAFPTTKEAYQKISDKILSEYNKVITETAKKEDSDEDEISL